MGVPRLVSADSDSGKLPDVVLYDLGTRFPPAGTAYTKTESDGRFAPIGAAANSVAGLKWIPFGDSLTSSQGGGAPDMGWTVQSTMLSDGQFVEFRNAGIVGNNASDLRARLQADVLAYSPNLVSLWIGTNDVTQSRTFDAYKTDVQALVTALKSASITPVLFTIPPRADNTKYTTISAWNLWLKTYAQEQRISLVDAYAILVDPATGAYKSGYDSGDGIHVSMAGHNAVAQEFVNRIGGRVPAGGVLRPRYTQDANNLLTNGLLLTNVDASPSIPDGWLRSGGTAGVTETIVQDSDFYGGTAWEVACINPTSAPQFLQSGKTDWSVGDQLLFVLKAKVVSSSGLSSTKGLRVNANFFGAASPTSIVGRYLQLPGLKGIITKRFTVPAGTTGPVQVACIFDVDTTASATYRVGEFAIYNLTRLGLV
jgi:lysophospholipase L1-like esterase